MTVQEAVLEQLRGLSPEDQARVLEFARALWSREHQPAPARRVPDGPFPDPARLPPFELPRPAGRVVDVGAGTRRAPDPPLLPVDGG